MAGYDELKREILEGLAKARTNGMAWEHRRKTRNMGNRLSKGYMPTLENLLLLNLPTELLHRCYLWRQENVRGSNKRDDEIAAELGFFDDEKEEKKSVNLGIKKASVQYYLQRAQMVDMMEGDGEQSF